MSSGFPGDFNNLAGRSMPIMNPNNPRSFRSPMPGIVSESSQMGLRGPDLIGKRSLAEFQQHQQLQQQTAAYLRNVKPRVSYNPVDFLISPEISSVSNGSSPSPSLSVPRYGVPILRQFRPQSAERFDFGDGNFVGNYQINDYNKVLRGSLSNLEGKKSPENQETESKMMNRLQELEKELLFDDEDGENDAVSVVTNSEWSETFQKSLSPSQATQKPDNTISPSPTTSSSSSCASTSSPAAMISPKQLISEAAAAINDGKDDSAAEIITRLNQVSNAGGTPEQRLSFYMTSAFRSRLNPPPPQSSPASELYKKDHVLSTQLLYDKSPCFKLAFMAANNTILEAGSGQKKIHVVDFDIGQGVQYVYLLHEMAAAARGGYARYAISLKLTTFSDFGNGGVERLKIVGDGLNGLANKLGVSFCFNVLGLKLRDLSREVLMVENGDVLAVNFGFKLSKLPDESVTTDNLRDEVLRRVKALSPAVVTVVEQEMSANTASFATRVNDACGYYGALFDSFDSTFPRDNPERVKIEEGLGRRLVNSVACEGRDRVERCEVLGKWRVRLSMAGLSPKPLSQLIAELMKSKLNSGTRVNPGFTVKEDGGGICFGWMGRTLNVVSAWH